MNFNIGDKVYIKGHWNFPYDCRGIISAPPDYAIELVEDQDPWEGIHRFVQSLKGPIEFFWIKFDETQLDSDGDGPYSEAEVEAEFISLIQ